MDEKQLQLLWDMHGKNGGFASFDEFKNLMNDDNSRKAYFEHSNKDLGFKDYNDFDQTLKKKDVSALGSQDAGTSVSPTLSQSQSPKEDNGAVDVKAASQANEQQNHPSIYDSYNPVDIALDADANSKKTKIISVPEGVKGTNINKEIPDEDAVKKAQQQNDYLKSKGYNPDELNKDFADFPKEAYAVPGYSKDELLQLKKDNPELYDRTLAAAKWEVPLEKGLHDAFKSNQINEDQYNSILHNILSPNGGYNTYEEGRQQVKNNRELIEKYIPEGDLKKNILANFQKDASYLYGKGTTEIYVDSRSKYLNDDQIKGLHYLEDTNPEMAAGYRNLLVDPKKLQGDENAMEGYEARAKKLEEVGLGIQQKYVNEESNKLAAKIQSGEPLSDDENKKLSDLKLKNESLKESFQNLNAKYPKELSNDIDNTIKEMIGQKVSGLSWAAAKTGEEVGNTLQGVSDFFGEPFRNEEESKIHQLAALGEGNLNDRTLYLRQENQPLKSFDLQFNPELKKQIDPIVNDKNLSWEDKYKKIYPLLYASPNEWGKVPIQNGKLNITPSSMFYSVAGMAASLAPYIALEAATGGGATAGLTRKLASSFTAAAATSFHETYVNAIRDGEANPYGYAMRVTAINSAALAGAGTPDAIKSMLGTKTAIGELVNKMSDAEINSAIKENSKTLQAFGKTIKTKPITDAAKGLGESLLNSTKEGAKVTAFTTAGNVANDAISGNDIDTEKLFKQGLVSTLTFAVGGGLLGAKANIDKVSDLQKDALFRASKQPELFMEALGDQRKNGTVTTEQYNNISDNIKKAAEVQKKVPFVDSEGNPLSVKQRGDLLLLKMQEENINTDAKKDNPPVLQEKLDKELVGVQEKQNAIYDSKENKTDSTIPKNISEIPEVKQREDNYNTIINNPDSSKEDVAFAQSKLKELHDDPVGYFNAEKALVDPSDKKSLDEYDNIIKNISSQSKTATNGNEKTNDAQAERGQEVNNEGVGSETAPIVKPVENANTENEKTANTEIPVSTEKESQPVKGVSEIEQPPKEGEPAPTESENKTSNSEEVKDENKPPEPPKGNSAIDENGKEPNKVGVSHESLTNIAKKLGLKEPDRGTRFTNEQQADRGRQILNAGADIEQLEKDVKDGKQPTADDVSVARAHLEDLHKIADAMKDKWGVDSKQYGDANKEIERFSNEVMKPIGSKTSDPFAALQGERDIDTGSFTSVKKAVEENTNKKATPQQENKINELTTAHKEIQKKSNESESKLIEETDKDINEGQPSKNKGAKRKSSEDYAKERKASFEAARKALKDLRSGKGGLGVSVPFARELAAIAPHVADIIKSYFGEGIDKFTDIVEKLHDEFSKDIIGLRKRDIMDVIAGDYNKKNDLTKSPDEEKLADIRQQARLTKKLQDLQNDLPEDFDKNKKEQSSEVKKLLEQIKKVKEDLDNYKGTSEQNRLNSLQKKLDDLRSGEEKEKSTPIEKTEKEKDLLEQIEQEKINQALKKLQRQFDGKKDNKFTPDEAKALWDYARKQYLDKGVSFNEMIKKVALDTGLKFEQVSNAITSPKIKSISDEMWAKQAALRRSNIKVKDYIDNQKGNPIGKFLKSLSKFPKGLATALHGHIFAGTHYPMGFLTPLQWGIYFNGIGKAWRNAYGSEAYHEKEVQALTSRPLYTLFKRSGLQNDVDNTNIDEFEKGGKIFGALGRTGAKGFLGMKWTRQMMAENYWNNLSEGDKTDESAKAISGLVNLATGASNLKIPNVLQEGMFAAGMESARWGRLFKNPAKALEYSTRILHDIYKGNAIRPEDKVFLKVWGSRVGQQVGTMVAFLAANAFIQSKLNPKNPVNLTDPTKNDFLKFKAGNTDIDLSGGTLGVKNFLSSIGTYAINDKNNQQEIGHIGGKSIQYLRGKLSPLYGDIADVGLGTDFSGNPLPFSNKKPAAGNHKLEWGEYLFQKAPIFIAEAVKNMYDDAAKNGLNKTQTEKIVNGIMQSVITTGTGVRTSDSYQKQNSSKEIKEPREPREPKEPKEK